MISKAGQQFAQINKRTLFMGLAAAIIAAAGMGLEAALTAHTMGGEQYALLTLIGLWAQRKSIVYTLAVIATALIIFSHPEILQGFEAHQVHDLTAVGLTWILATIIAINVARYQGISKMMRHVQQDSKAIGLQLVQILEALPQGFALFDTDDRLVVSNQRYQDLMPEFDSRLIAGNTFERILRESAQVGTGGGQVDEDGIAQRLARHRDPGDPFEQQLPNGEWRLVNERHLDDGSMVSQCPPTQLQIRALTGFAEESSRW